MGPPLRSFAPMRIAASWFGSGETHRIQGCGVMLSRPAAGPPRHRHPGRNQHVAVLGAIKDKPSRAREVRVLDSSCARRRLRRTGRGEETGFQVEQKKLDWRKDQAACRKPVRSTRGPGMSRSFTRKELYDLVWSEPMRDIAKRLEISDVGLAKACRNAEIPVPPRG